MKETVFVIESNRHLAPGVFELVLRGDASGIRQPGQFAEIAVPGQFLRRPVSVCDWTPDSLTLLVRAVGRGTRWMEAAAPGESLSLLLPLGNGFDIAAAPAASKIVLAGGGIGIAPLYALARILAEAGRGFSVALGFRSASDVFYAGRFAEFGHPVAVSTEDGTEGVKGFVTDAIRSLGIVDGGYVFACGPMPMMRALASLPGIAGAQFSLEARMGCGFGACMGCTIETADGPARICHEGPVFRREALKW